MSCPVTTWLKKLSPSSQYCVRKSNALACCFNLCSSISIFGTQRAHNFRNLSLSDTISWRSDREIWRKCRESDVMVNQSAVLPNLPFNCTHQILIHHRWLAAPRIIMHTFASFIKESHPSPYHRTTQGMFSIHVTKLTMNFSQFHVLHIQETDCRPHSTCGGILYFLKHYKHTAWCVNTVRMSANCVHALLQNQQARHACTLSWLQCCSSNIRKRNLFSG